MGARGFTLVETLVALAIFSLIALGGVSLLSFTADSQAASSARLERLAQLERARALLSADLSQAADRPTRALDGQDAPAFLARSGADGLVLALVRRGWENPEGRPRASLQYVEYALVEGRLERRARAMVDGAPLGPAATLLEGVEAVEFAIWQGDRWAGVEGGALRGPPPRAIQLSLSTQALGPLRIAAMTAQAQ